MIDESVYPDMDGFWSDLSAVYAEEVKRLAALGCTYLQLDDTSLAYLNDPRHASRWRSGEKTPSISTSATYGRSTRRWPIDQRG